MSSTRFAQCAGPLLPKVLGRFCAQNPGVILREYGVKSADEQKELAKVFLDEETVKCCFGLFSNNLNVSLTAKQLYMHRNTLTYRLNKLKSHTGLDVRVFSDAVTFIMLYHAFTQKGKA